MLLTKITQSQPFVLLIGLTQPRWLHPWRSGALLYAFVSMIWLSPVAVAELYKYTSEDGVTVLDSHVPARYVKGGYTILSLDGRVMEVVERALSEQEIRARDSALAESEAKDRQVRERKIADQNLLRIYSTPADVTRARDTKLSSIDGYIAISKSNLQRLQVQKRNFESELADVERRGGEITRDRIDHMRSIENLILQATREINEKEQELSDITASFASDLARVTKLYGIPPRG
ncbi:MAG: hypothetical protein ACI90G_000566 [Urechidicola sp.]|jgi:hypothetical protein